MSWDRFKADYCKQLSNLKNIKTPWLFKVFLGDEVVSSTQLCGDHFVNHYEDTRIPIVKEKQYMFYSIHVCQTNRCCVPPISEASKTTSQTYAPVEPVQDALGLGMRVIYQATNFSARRLDEDTGFLVIFFQTLWWLMIQNPAPPRMMIIPLFIGFKPFQVVQDFFHQQYLVKFYKWIDLWLLWYLWLARLHSIWLFSYIFIVVLQWQKSFSVPIPHATLLHRIFCQRLWEEIRRICRAVATQRRHGGSSMHLAVTLSWYSEGTRSDLETRLWSILELGGLG